jgi:molecular chaperone GrpE
MPLKMIALLGWTLAVLCGIGWFWQLVKTQQGAELLTKAKARVAELTGGLRSATQERDAAFQRSREREAQAKQFGHEGVVRDVLPVIDDFERALHPSMAQDPQGLFKGVKMVRRQLLDTLTRHGVEVFDAEGHAFDPRKHEAVDQVPTEEHAPGTIVAQQSAGYMLNGRLLRAARVIVAVPPLDEPDPTLEVEEA